MYCKYCGKPVADNAVFCGDCGRKVNENTKTEAKSDSSTESLFKSKFSLFELSIVKLLGFILILCAIAVIGAAFLTGNSLSNAIRPPFLLIPFVFIFGLYIVFSSNYNLALSIGLTLFFLVIYFIPESSVGGFFWFAKPMVSMYQKNNQRLSALLTYSGSLMAIVTCSYLTIVGILSRKDFYFNSKRRGLISIIILIGFLFFFIALPFTRKLAAGTISNSGIGGFSPGDIFISSYLFQQNFDDRLNRWTYEFKIENKREDGKETIIDKIISNRGEIPLNEENIKAQGATLEDNKIIIPLNTPAILTIYSSEPFYSLNINTDKLDADFLFIK